MSNFEIIKPRNNGDDIEMKRTKEKKMMTLMKDSKIVKKLLRTFGPQQMTTTYVRLFIGYRRKENSALR